MFKPFPIHCPLLSLPHILSPHGWDANLCTSLLIKPLSDVAICSCYNHNPIYLHAINLHLAVPGDDLTNYHTTSGNWSPVFIANFLHLQRICVFLMGFDLLYFSALIVKCLYSLICDPSIFSERVFLLYFQALIIIIFLPAMSSSNQTRYRMTRGYWSDKFISHDCHHISRLLGLFLLMMVFQIICTSIEVFEAYGTQVFS